MEALWFLKDVVRSRSVGCGSQTVWPQLADSHKVGFFSLDRCSQTEVSEIVDLKEMTEVLQILLQDVANLRRDINFTKHVMQADYESKLQQKSLDLYCRINERVAELEKVHEERVNTIRRAFRQQLSDAIARVAVLYNKNLERKINREKNKQASDANKLDEKYRELQATIERNEQVIQMLKMQIQQYQNKEEVEESLDEEGVKSKTPSLNIEAEELREEVQKLEKKLERIGEALEIKEEETSQLNKDISTLQEHLEKEKIFVEQLKYENEELKAASEKDIASQKKLLESQRIEMERLMEERIRKAKEQTMADMQKNANEMKQTERDKIKLMMDQKKLLEDQLVRERAKNAAKSQEDVDLEKLKKNEQRLKEEIIRLKKEIEKVHRTWEKKFAILQQSLHALKDESYLRQSLQRQAATLHHAAVSYAADTPAGIVSVRNQGSEFSSPRKPLPDITPKTGRSGKSNPHDKDYLSYTVSAPSGRATTIFSADENQIMSDNEQDVPKDCVLLPDPPSQVQKDNSRPPSSKSQVEVSSKA